MNRMKQLTIVSYRLTRENLPRMDELDAMIIKAVGLRSCGSGAGLGWRDVEFDTDRPLDEIKQAVKKVPVRLYISRA